MLITTKEELHIVIDEMLTRMGEPQEIGICESYIQYDEDMYVTRDYKGIELTYYSEWFAQGRIIIR
tara:strand:- start:502 stop:699 length:198 start_codon:yes stop_codon:yes gene_type:complete